jgi:hypothetical protein
MLIGAQVLHSPFCFPNSHTNKSCYCRDLYYTDTFANFALYPYLGIASYAGNSEPCALDVP